MQTYMLIGTFMLQFKLFHNQMHKYLCLCDHLSDHPTELVISAVVSCALQCAAYTRKINLKQVNYWFEFSNMSSYRRFDIGFSWFNRS